MSLSSSPTILIVEDEPKLAALMGDYLRESGYTSDWLADGLEVVERVRNDAPALILLDIMLPGKDGMQICRELRAFTDIPIIMVTARVEEIDRLLGLELGADDYICKPFSPREVVARVKAVLRRLERPQGGTHEDLGFQLDEDGYRATLDGELLELTPVEFRLLRTLLKHPGRVYSRDQLMDKVYTDLRVVSDRTVDTHVKNLRKKIKGVRPDQELIRSVYGVGYRLGD